MNEFSPTGQADSAPAQDATIVDRRKPRVAQVLYSGLGGHGGVVMAMLQANGATRWRTALGFLGIEPLLAAYADFCTARDIPFHYMQATARRPWKSYASLARWLWAGKPDVVILHASTALPGVLPYVRWRGVPLIVVEHQANDLKSRQEWLFSFLSMRLADAVVTLTPRYQDELAQRLGKWFRHDKVMMIPNGIDIAALGPATPLAGGEAMPVLIGMAGRFSATKRFDILIDALAVLQRTGGRSWRLSLAGAGEQWDQVRAYAATRGIDAIRFEGMLTGTALADWYRGLDVYCHASDGETLSVSVLQAMASGVPVVGSNVDGISNLLAGDPPLGTLVATPTAEGFAAALEAMARDPAQAQAMARRGRAEAERLYDQNMMFARYDALVEGLSSNTRMKQELQ